MIYFLLISVVLILGGLITYSLLKSQWQHDSVDRRWKIYMGKGCNSRKSAG